MVLRMKRHLSKIVRDKRLNQGRSGAKLGSHVSLMKPMMNTRSRELKGKLSRDCKDTWQTFWHDCLGWTWLILSRQKNICNKLSLQSTLVLVKAAVRYVPMHLFSLSPNATHISIYNNRYIQPRTKRCPQQYITYTHCRFSILSLYSGFINLETCSLGEWLDCSNS